MALPILDGNQSATTLSTIVTGGQHIPAHTVISLGSQAISDITSAVSGVQISGSVNVNGTNFDGDGNLLVTLQPGDSPYTQPISGTVTANVWGFSDNDGARQICVLPGDVIPGETENHLVVRPSNSPLDPLSISGTVTVSGFASVSVGSGAILAAGSRNGTIVPLPLDSGSGNLAVQLKQSSGPSNDPISNTNPLWVTAVNTTVTVGAMPSGALTTRFGSVTTANTAQLTSAVTNTSRKFLLVQNIATSTVTIGIGFVPTTTQGIQLTAGAGLTLDAFCPTGGVWWLSGVTSSNFCVIEG